jgi:hypothetical protein
LLKVCSIGRFRKSNTHCCWSPALSVQPLAPIAMSLTVSVVAVIVAGPLMGAHLVVTASHRAPFTVVNCALMPSEATHERSWLFAVPEMPVYVLHGADSRNAAHVSVGGEVMVEPGAGLVDVADSTETGTAFPGPPVPVSPQDVRTMPRDKRGTV